MTAEPMSVGADLRTGHVADADILVKAARRHEAIRRTACRQRRRLRHPARLDRLAHRPQRRGQDDVLQHDHRRLRADVGRDHLRRHPIVTTSGAKVKSMRAARGDQARHRRGRSRTSGCSARCPRSTTSWSDSTRTCEPLVGRDRAHAAQPLRGGGGASSAGTSC